MLTVISSDAHSHVYVLPDLLPDAHSHVYVYVLPDLLPHEQERGPLYLS
jgi:hypothetical protein